MRRSTIYLIAVCAAIFGSQALHANRAGYVKRTAIGGPGDNEQLIVGDSEEKESWFEKVVLPHWEGFKGDVKDSSGLQFSINYTANYLHASSTLPGRKKEAAGGVFDLTGSWKVFHRKEQDFGIVGFRVENRHRLGTSIAPNAIGSEIGSLWKPDVLWGEFDTTLSQLWYEKSWDEKSYAIRFGKLNTPAIYYDNHLLKVPYFLSQNEALIFSGIAFPSNGLGALGGAWIGEQVYLLGGIHDANGSPTTTGFDTFFETREYFTAAEIGWSPSQDLVKETNIHLTGWHSDARNEKGLASGWGLSFSAQHVIEKRWVALSRISYSDTELTPTRLLATLGGGRKFRSYDFLGATLSWGQASNRQLRDQTGLESFYRLMVTPRTSIIPTLHLIFNPSNNPNKDMIAILGIRARFSL